MRILPTVYKAKTEIARLEKYVFLAESYGEQTLEKQIIKHYAYIGSISKTVAHLNEKRANEGLAPIELSYAKEVIQSKPADALHRMVRTRYRQKIRHLQY